MSDNKICLINVWGIKFNLLSLQDFIDVIHLRLQSGRTPIHITGINPETVVHASKDKIIHQAILESDLVNIDNNLVLWLLRMSGYKAPERVATPDLFEDLIKLANKKQYKVFVLGSKESVLKTALKNIKSDYPKLRIEGHHGYYDREKERSIVELINNFTPDMLFIALPSPEKESFILKYKYSVKAQVFLGVGGAIDWRAGLVKRPSGIFKKLPLEGLFRSLQSPMNYGKRYLTFYPAFFKIVIKSIIRKNK